MLYLHSICPKLWDWMVLDQSFWSLVHLRYYISHSSTLFQTCLQMHTILKEWTIHCITPIHKSGDRSLVANYRPISLLSSTSKVWRVWRNKCYTHLASSLSVVSGKGQSTLQQLLLFYTKVLDTLGEGKQCDVIFLDFSKAFDTVPHQELLLKLRSLGVSEKLWIWLQNYLTGRMQCVQVGEERSQLLPVLSGVPQGSNLGPLLFLA